ncbi:MAG: hypothetical protein LBS79_05140 [Tannerella sp.]|jgi:hypothetical protein|nr:hypothetical protein [Tannerella sp.]
MKVKIPGGKIVKYLRELSIVAIGIAIVLPVNSRLMAGNGKKDMARCEAVRSDMIMSDTFGMELLHGSTGGNPVPEEAITKTEEELW